jgi:chemotaxis methyl-accepting protein methylase
VPGGDLDVIVIDRTLHMLDAEARLAVLARVYPALRQTGYVLIADERSNLPAMREFFKVDRRAWSVVKATRGFLFLQCLRESA